MCVHPSHVCDGMLQCPQRDDELFCNLTCPPGCTCLGLAFTCSRSFQAGLHPRLRYLHVSGDEAMTPALLKDNVMLVYLSLARCGLTSADDLRFPNLHTVDLSDNRIRAISFDQLSFLVNLKSLCLSGSPVTALFSDGPSGQSPIPQLLKLDLSLSRVDLEVLNVSALDPLTKLRTLSVSHSGVSRVLTAEGKVPGKDPAHVALTSLRVLDVRGCPMTQLPTDLFSSLKDLSDVYADTYRMCCPDLLPPAFDVIRCRAPSNLISSCRSLLASDTVRLSLRFRCFCADWKFHQPFRPGLFEQNPVCLSIPCLPLSFSVLRLSDESLPCSVGVCGHSVQGALPVGRHRLETKRCVSDGWIYLPSVAPNVSVRRLPHDARQRLDFVRFPRSKTSGRQVRASGLCGGLGLMLPARQRAPDDVTVGVAQPVGHLPAPAWFGGRAASGQPVRAWRGGLQLGSVGTSSDGTGRGLRLPRLPHLRLRPLHRGDDPRRQDGPASGDQCDR